MNETRSGTYALLVLFAINTMNFYDRQILGALAEPIKKEWQLSDTALGGLGTAFVLLYALIGLPLGRLSDFFRRTRILAVGVFFWSLMTGASGLARNYWQLFGARLAVGVGEASCAPAASSLIGDYFAAGGRARALSIFMMGLPVGTALSFLISAYVAQKAHWSTALFVAVIPGLACAIAAAFMEEPRRGQSETHQVGHIRREGSPYWLVLSIPTMWWIILSGALHNFNMYAIGSFMTSFVLRVHKIELMQAGMIMAVVYGFSGIPGLLVGGIWGDRVHRRKKNGRMVVGAAGIALSVPLALLALSGETVWAFAVPMAVAIGATYVYYSTVYATIQDIIEPSLRGTAMALYFCAMYVLGAALGPYATGFLSDYLARRAATQAGVDLAGLDAAATVAALKPYSAVGLHQAMYVIPILSAILAAVLWAGSRTVTRDVERLETWMRSQAQAG